MKRANRTSSKSKKTSKRRSTHVILEFIGNAKHYLREATIRMGGLAVKIASRKKDAVHFSRLVVKRIIEMLGLQGQVKVVPA